MIRRLLRSLHGAVFDKSPKAGIVFRINYAGGLRWLVADEVLIVEVESRSVVFDLSHYTVGELAGALRSEGVVVLAESAAFFGRSARVLMDGQGDASRAGQDALLGFQAPNWFIMAAYAAELRLAKQQVPEALRQMIIWQSEGEWLELWGELYGVPALPGETEAEHQKRIPEEAFRLRVNRFAIEQAVLDLTGKRIHLRENWGRMFRLDFSRLSGTHRLVSGEAWRYGYIQPYAKELFDWGDALAIIQRNKAAGVLVFEPTAEIDRFVHGQMEGDISFGVTQADGIWVRPTFDFRVDHLKLSVTHPHRNWTAATLSTMVLVNAQGSGTWRSVDTNWAKKPWSSYVEHFELDGTTAFSRITTTEWRADRTWNGGSWRTWNG